MPGPGSYEAPSANSDAVLAVRMAVYSSMFKPSATDRFGQPIVRHHQPPVTPGPGTYEISTFALLSCSCCVLISRLGLYLTTAEEGALNVVPKPTRKSLHEKQKRPVSVMGGGARGRLQRHQDPAFLAAAAAVADGDVKTRDDNEPVVVSPLKSSLGKIVKELNSSNKNLDIATHSSIKPPGPGTCSAPSPRPVSLPALIVLFFLPQPTTTLRCIRRTNARSS